MSLCQDYLSARGITDDSVRIHKIELDQRVSLKTARDRLGQGFPKGVNEVIWFPLHDSVGKIISWIARPLPTIAGLPKFLCPICSGGPLYIPKGVHGLDYGKPVIITEGPVKALVCVQAGVAAIGLNGVWGASQKTPEDKIRLRDELRSALDWRGRKVYICFDADSTIKPDVRHASFRLFLMLLAAGAETFQLTNWDLVKGKGIDDYLVNQLQSNSQSKPEDVLANLFAAANPFVESINANSLDIQLISIELGKVEIPVLVHDQICKPLANKLGVPVDDLRKIGRTSRSQSDFHDPDPWQQPVPGDSLLAELTAIIDTHVVIEDSCKVATALWIVLTFLIDVVDIMPILAITSPDKRCGKTRLLSVLLRLVRRPIPGVSLTAATIYRLIEKYHPTLTVDEADGMLRDNQGHDNLELRNVINSSHTRDFAFVPRCVGDSHDAQLFSTWAPKAIALIGKMPDSMMDRSIPIPMRRKTKGESVKRIRETSKTVFEELKSRITRFVEDNAASIAQFVPDLPKGLNDRAEDCWLPLLAIADTAAGIWPDLARKAALELCADSDDQDTFITKLLRALKQDFEDEGQTGNNGFLSTADICAHLNQDNEAPWAGLKNKLTAELLTKKLRPFKVKSERVTIAGQQQRGFHWRKLKPTFDRYL